MNTIRQYFCLLILTLFFAYAVPINPEEAIKYNIFGQKLPSKLSEVITSLKDQIHQFTSELPKLRQCTRKCFEYYCRSYGNVENIPECINKLFLTPIIVGGRVAERGEFPHMGAVGWKSLNNDWIFLCGSSLISTKFMLTAAHCSKVSSRTPNVADSNPKVVRLGLSNIREGKESYSDYNIKNFIVHPGYKSPLKYNDIALIELQSKVTFDDYIQPACLWAKFETNTLGTEANVTGWGLTKHTTEATSESLQVAEVDILPSSDCDNRLPRSRLWNGTDKNQICAGVLSGGVDTCQGDSGGPLQVGVTYPKVIEETMYILIGVTAFGFRCGVEDTPSIYSRVSSYVDWIEENVWSKQ